MSVAGDAASAGAGGDNVASISWTHIPVSVPSAVGIQFAGYAATIEAYDLVATYGGVSAPRAVAIFDNIVTGQTEAIFGLASPPTGAQTIVVSPNGGGAFYGNGGALTVTGSDTSTVFSNVVSATGNSASASVTCGTTADEILIDAGSSSAGSASVASGQSLYIYYNAAGVLPCFGSAKSGASGGVMAWTVTLGIWNLCAASFKVAGAAGVATTSAILLAGLGSGGLTKAIRGAGVGAMG